MGRWRGPRPVIELPALPDLIFPEHYQANRPAIIRPGVDLKSYFPVDFDRRTRRAVLAELAKTGRVEAAFPFAMAAAARQTGISVTYTGTFAGVVGGVANRFFTATVDIGAPSADRVVLAFLAIGASSSRTIDAGRIDGTGMTSFFASPSAQPVNARICRLAYPTGTTAVIEGEASGSILNGYISIVILRNQESELAVASDSVAAGSGTSSRRTLALVDGSVGFWFNLHGNSNPMTFSSLAGSVNFSTGVPSLGLLSYRAPAAGNIAVTASWTGSAPRTMLAVAYK